MNRTLHSAINRLRIKKQRLLLQYKILSTQLKLRLSNSAFKDSVSLTFEIKNALGIGAKLVWVLEILAYCNERGILPNFKFSYPDSKRDDNYFTHFFYIKNFQEKTFNTTITFDDIEELRFKKGYNAELDLDFANALIQQYLGIKTEVIQEVDNFCAANLPYKHILGVHYRGTDKVCEAPKVPYEKVLENITFYLSNCPDIEAVFLSTDDRNFEYYLKENFKQKTLILRQDYFRSQDDSSIHNNKALCKFRINEDAILNCLILSRCQGLLKCSSLLTDWSVLFNPDISLVMLNSPYDEALWFPTRNLLQRVKYASI